MKESKKRDYRGVKITLQQGVNLPLQNTDNAHSNTGHPKKPAKNSLTKQNWPLYNMYILVVTIDRRGVL